MTYLLMFERPNGKCVPSKNVFGRVEGGNNFLKMSAATFITGYPAKRLDIFRVEPGDSVFQAMKGAAFGQKEIVGRGTGKKLDKLVQLNMTKGNVQHVKAGSTGEAVSILLEAGPDRGLARASGNDFANQLSELVDMSVSIASWCFEKVYALFDHGKGDAHR
jgi:hypothetical protein